MTTNVPQPSSFMVNVQTAPFIPLSASYPYDDKTSFNAEYFQFPEGYSLFSHPIFTQTKDVKLAKDTFINLTSTLSLADILTDQQYIRSTDLVIFTGFLAANGRYITNNNNTLYATATSLGEREFFVVKRNTDGTFAISQNNMYWTVNQNNPWDVSLSDIIVNDSANVQKFNIFTAGSGFNIQTTFEAPWWSETSTPPQYLTRFVTFAHTTSSLYAIGMIADDDYTARRNYTFFSTNNIDTFVLGYDGILKWIRYYNEIANEEHQDGTYRKDNRTTNIFEVIQNVLHNYLVTSPYKTQISITQSGSAVKTGDMKVDIANLKNVMTPEYEYAVKETEI